MNDCEKNKKIKERINERKKERKKERNRKNRKEKDSTKEIRMKKERHKARKKSKKQNQNEIVFAQLSSLSTQEIWVELNDKKSGYDQARGWVLKQPVLISLVLHLSVQLCFYPSIIRKAEVWHFRVMKKHWTMTILNDQVRLL